MLFHISNGLIGEFFPGKRKSSLTGLFLWLVFHGQTTKGFENKITADLQKEWTNPLVAWCKQFFCLFVFQNKMNKISQKASNEILPKTQGFHVTFLKGTENRKAKGRNQSELSILWGLKILLASRGSDFEPLGPWAYRLSQSTCSCRRHLRINTDL